MGVGVNVAVAVGVGVNVAVAVGVAVGVGVGVVAGQLFMLMESTRQPWTATLLSLPRRQRSTIFCPTAAAGRFTVVVMKPPELPVHAERPASGLPQQLLIVPL